MIQQEEQLEQEQNINNILKKLETPNSLRYFTKDVLSKNLDMIFNHWHSHEKDYFELLSSLLPDNRDILINILYNRAFVSYKEIIKLFKNPNAMKILNNDNITDENIIEEIKKNINVLVFIPDNRFTKEIVYEAINHDFEALFFIPDNRLTDEHLKFAIDKDFNSTGKHEASLPKIEDDRLTDELIIYVLTQNGKSLDSYHAKMIKKSHCEQAVTQNGYALKYVPNNLKTLELLNLALANNPQKNVSKLMEYYECNSKRTYDDDDYHQSMLHKIGIGDISLE